MAERKIRLGLDEPVRRVPAGDPRPERPSMLGGLGLDAPIEEEAAPLTTAPPTGGLPQPIADRLPFAVEKARIADEYRDLTYDRQTRIEAGEYESAVTLSGYGLNIDAPRSEFDTIEEPKEGDSDSAFLEPDYTIANPAEDTGESSSTFRNVANFMFSDEMGLLGMKWDQEGFTWAWENFTNQLVEHPYSTGFTLAAYLVPLGAAWAKGSRIAGRALKLADEGGDVGAAAGKGLFGATYEAGKGTFQKGAGHFRFDDHVRMVKSLAGSSTAADGRKFFSDGMQAKILASSAEETAKLVPEKMLRKMLISDFHRERWLEMQVLAKSGALDAMPGIKGVANRAYYSFSNNFTNKYMRVLNDTGADEIESLDKFYKRMKFGTLLGAAPTQLGRANQELAYKYMLGEATEDALVKGIGDDNATFVKTLVGKSKELFKSQADEGFLSDEQVALFAKGVGGVETGFHLPAVKPATANFEELSLWAKSVGPGKFGQLIERKRFDPAKILTGPTMKKRGKLRTKEAVLEALPSLETDLGKLTIGGYITDNVIFQVHRGFRDILTAGMRGEPRATHWVKNIDEWEKMGDIAQKNFLPLDKLDEVAPGLSARMRRMLKADLDKTNEGHLLTQRLPVIDRDLVEQFFSNGPQSAYGASSMIGQFAELLTAVHKTSRTALNLPTHTSNLLGNMMFLGMAGMNPFSAQALNDGSKMTKMFTKIARDFHKLGPEATVDDLMTPENLKRLLGKDRFIKDKVGNKIDISELFGDELMRDLFEGQAFESIEGLTHVKKTLNQLKDTGEKGFTAKVVETVGRSIAGVGEVPGVKQTLQGLSSAYLGEDMIPKMMYAMHLAREGWGRDAILREVGRRLPQYRTVGSVPNKLRRIILPWITFPAEAARIIKNNMADNPVNMMAWMQGPEIAQSLASAAGVSPDFEDIESTIDAAPPWGVKYQSVFLKGEQAPTVLGAVGGGGIGSMAGAAVGGARGAVAGLAIGALAGRTLGSMSPGIEQAKHAEITRSWIMDFLPQSTMFLSSLAPHQWEKVNPFGDAPTGGIESFRAAKDLMPIEPFAVAMPILDLYAGRGGFGQELEARSGISLANKMALGLLGFVSPPVLQKYGMKLEGPGGVHISMKDIHENNGGQMTLPRAATATFGGLVGAGMAFMGTKRLGVPSGAATALAGTIGTMAGAEANTRRLMTDLGILGDPRTGETGDWTLDFFSNSFMGLNKSFKVTAKQAEFNQAIRRRRFEPIRKVATREFTDSLKAGSESSAKVALSEVYKTFLYEWGDAEKATQHTNAWMQRQIQGLNKLPMFRGLSEEWLMNRISALNSLGPEKTKMHQQQIIELMTEMRMHAFNKGRSLKIVDGE